MINSVSRTSIWLVNVLLNYERLSLAEISALWAGNTELSNGEPFHRIRLQRAIASTLDMFGIVIECDRRDGYRYYIVANENQKAAEWLISSHAVNKAISESRQMGGRILLEEIPAGQYHLSTIVEAMVHNQVLEMKYRKFADSEPYTSLVEPYSVKLSHQRWYLLGRKDHRPHLQIFALDRIQQLRILPHEEFQMPADFCPAEYFEHYFGVHTGGGLAPSSIRIRANSFWSNYLRTLPIHRSQRVVETTPDGCIFEFVMASTPDLLNHLLSYGPGIEVLEPSSLRDLLRDNVRQMSLLYEGKA